MPRQGKTKIQFVVICVMLLLSIFDCCNCSGGMGGIGSMVANGRGHHKWKGRRKLTFYANQIIQFYFSGIYRPRASVRWQPAYASVERESAHIDPIALLCSHRDLTCEKGKRRKIVGTASRFHSVANDAGAIVACCRTSVRR